MRPFSVVLLTALACACSGDEPHPCDEGTPTCDSSLVVLLPDPRTQFTLHLSDELGMKLDVDCPLPEAADEQIGDYTVFCGGGRLTINTFRSFGDSVEVRLEEALPKVYTPQYQKGGDYCGNPCTTGTIQL